MQIVTYEEDRLVKRHRGTMPAILTSPHDGTNNHQMSTSALRRTHPMAAGSSPANRANSRHRRAWALIVAIAASTVINLVGSLEPASARPPRCNEETGSCPERPDPPGGPTGPSDPEPQPIPPQPFGQYTTFGYANFIVFAESGIVTTLNEPQPPDQQPWPLPDNIPFSPDIPGAPVSVTEARPGLWAFASYAASAAPTECGVACRETPIFTLNRNTGLYEASLGLKPRLEIEFWQVSRRSPAPGQPKVLVPDFVTEVTATLHLRAVAQCPNWQTGGPLVAKIGISDVTIRRDTTIEEDIFRFLFSPHFTARQNAEIRNRLIDKLNVGQFQDLPTVHGSCLSLGVIGDTTTGTIAWNPCRDPHCVAIPKPGGNAPP